jgi:hypothetical protein
MSLSVYSSSKYASGYISPPPTANYLIEVSKGAVIFAIPLLFRTILYIDEK